MADRGDMAGPVSGSRRTFSRRLRVGVGRQSGQVFPLVAVMIGGMIGTLSFVVDVGSWLQGHRHLQSMADAAALAGAESLPYDSTAAASVALSYASKNGTATTTIGFPSSDTIRVTVQQVASGFFSGATAVTITAEGRARAGLVTQAAGAVPFVFDKAQAQLTGCSGLPCFGQSVTLKINDDTTLGGGQTGLVDLRTDGDGSVTSQQLADWVSTGLTTAMVPNRYYSAAGSCKFSNQNFHTALDARIASGSPLLFPVYDPALSDISTNPPRYWIVGWVALVLTDYRLNGCGNKSDFVQGYFVHQITTGTSDGTATADYGVRVITLVDN